MGMLNAPLTGDAAPAGKTRYYVLENYYLKNGSQVSKSNAFLEKGLTPAMRKLHPAGPLLCLEALVASHMPQLAVIAGFASMEQYRGVMEKAEQHETYAAAREEWERGDEQPYEHRSVTLLEATDYSPAMVGTEKAPAAPRIFELRVYHSPTQRQLRALHERFAGPEIQIFHRVGVHPLFYSSTVFGPNMPNLTYVIPFDNLAAREKAWAAFGADPEWKKVRQESIDRHGQISSVIQMSLFRATSYSPVQ
jgi:hypothetical protein